MVNLESHIMSQPNIFLYIKPSCPFCIRAKQLFDSKGVTYTDVDITFNSELRREMIQKSGQRTVPQIWINDQHVGGSDDLFALERRGLLDSMLQ